MTNMMITENAGFLPSDTESILRSIGLNYEQREFAIWFLITISTNTDEFNHIPAYLIHNVARKFDRNMKYRQVLLKLEDNNIIETNHSYQVNEKTKSYKLHPLFLQKHNWNKISHLEVSYDIDVADHIIVQHLLRAYDKVTLPSLEEVVGEAHHLVQTKTRLLSGYGRNRTFKQCKLQSMSDRKIDSNLFKILDNDIKMYMNQYYKFVCRTLVPKEVSIGRIYDVINMMPKWIRRLVKIDGMNVVEIDFTALNPNLIYWLAKPHVSKEASLKWYTELAGDTHTALAKKLNPEFDNMSSAKQRDERILVKQQNLSYWNDRIRAMKNYPINTIIENEFPEHLAFIHQLKLSSERKTKKHAETAYRLFSAEVQLLSDIFFELDLHGLTALYCFDALWVAEDVADKVISIMNMVAINMGVPTIAE